MILDKQELKEVNRAFFLELAHFLQKSTFVLFIDRASEGVLTEIPIITEEKEIGILITSKEDANNLRRNTGNVLYIASAIPDNLIGKFHHGSSINIGSSFKVSFELANPILIEDKRLVTMKVSR